MAKTYPEYDYDLPEELFGELSDLSSAALLGELSRQAGAEEELAGFFRNYGIRLAEKVLEAGKKHKDRTSEVMEEAAEKTGLVFPGIPQRYIEIWLLATRPQDKWRILESTTRRFVFAVQECSIHREIAQKLPAASGLPCREGCLAFLNGIFSGLGLSGKVEMIGDPEKDGSCRFRCEPEVGPAQRSGKGNAGG
ncbi:MAG: hypothetical protein ACUVSK_08125 [Desulfotomaculales bacterium]